jgi:hypothetical protein
MPFPVACPFSPKLVLACAALLTLTACDRANQTPAAPAATSAATELSWARAALERNPRIEVMATDTDARVFTVKDRSTGEVRAIKLSEIAAISVAELKALDSRPAEPVADATPSEREQSAAPAATPSQPAQPVASASGTGQQVQAGSGNYTIERTGGQLRVSGPGVSIVSAGPAAGTSGGTGEGGQRTVEPIICEGRRMMQFDSRNIYVDGDAIIVRGGCELYITNSRIVASGTGVIVQDAVVHISNSHIEGSNASYDANDRAKMYVRSSTFQGVPRRTELAMVQDQGGNRWR